MAEHDGAAAQAEPVAAQSTDSESGDAIEVVDASQSATTTPVWNRFTGVPKPIAAGLAIIVALVGLGGWLGFRIHQDHQVQAQRNLFVQVARQTAINLTTISYTEVDADIKRVLDSATGGFHDEFQKRSKPFVEVVKKVQSKSQGSISEAGLLSSTTDQAQVLVAVSVKTLMGGAPPDQEPRRWRMRLTVDKTGDTAKVSNVEFVP